MNKSLQKERFKFSNLYSHHPQQARLASQDVQLDQLPLVDQDQLVQQDARPVQLDQNNVQPKAKSLDALGS